ncbi:MAG: DNA translocase FtsK, partial [Firmicutes bacterium]|nr:DNA translocase FtsK [Bacillota bacterium]
MAETKNNKKPSKSNKSTPNKSKKATTKVSYDTKNKSKSIADEILAIVVALIAILVFVSLVSTSMGIFGEFISTVLKGIVGVGAYAMPVLIVGYCIWYLANKERRFAYLKLFGILLFMVAVCGLVQYIFVGNVIRNDEGFFGLVRMFFYQSDIANGGVVGGVTAYALDKIVGKGTYIVLIAAILIAVIMATGKSCFEGVMGIFGFFKNKQRQKEAKIKAQAEYIKEKEAERQKKQERKEERAAKRKKFFDITLNGDEGYDKDVVFDIPFEEVSSSEDKTVENTFVPESIPFAGTIEMDEKENEYIEETIRVNEPVINVAEPKEEKAAEEVNAEPVKEKAEEESKPMDIDTSSAEDVEYVFPPIDLLDKGSFSSGIDSKTQMLNNAKKLEDTLKSFGVEARVVQINKGPTVTRYELSPSVGVKVSKIVNLADDIALNLASSGIRIEAPIPGKAAVGIEVPNKETQSVYLRTVIDSEAFKKHPSKVAFALGEDIAGNPVVADIAKMPHLLIAGATGSGKSVCINTLITSILYKASPKEVKLLLVDPKVVELSVYNGIPHLLIPVVTDPKKAAGALNWAVREMLARYQSFSETGVRDINGYNQMKKDAGEEELMPQIVIVIDELADLMMAAPGDVEDSICRLAQMARAAGMHLVIATQRPSVDVI